MEISLVKQREARVMVKESSTNAMETLEKSSGLSMIIYDNVFNKELNFRQIFTNCSSLN
jgi:hypothetical protein